MIALATAQMNSLLSQLIRDCRLASKVELSIVGSLLIPLLGLLFIVIMYQNRSVSCRLRLYTPIEINTQSPLSSVACAPPYSIPHGLFTFYLSVFRHLFSCKSRSVSARLCQIGPNPFSNNDPYHSFQFTFQTLSQAQLLHVVTSRWSPRWRHLCTQPSSSVQDAEPELVLLFSILRQRRRGDHHPHSGGSSCIRAFLWVFYQTQLGYGLVC